MPLSSSEIARKAALKSMKKISKERRSEIAKKAWRTRRDIYGRAGTRSGQLKEIEESRKRARRRKKR